MGSVGVFLIRSFGSFFFWDKSQVKMLFWGFEKSKVQTEVPAPIEDAHRLVHSINKVLFGFAAIERGERNITKSNDRFYHSLIEKKKTEEAGGRLSRERFIVRQWGLFFCSGSQLLKESWT